jgi:hypothetical protein
VCPPPPFTSPPLPGMPGSAVYAIGGSTAQVSRDHCSCSARTRCWCAVRAHTRQLGAGAMWRRLRGAAWLMVRVCRAECLRVPLSDGCAWAERLPSPMRSAAAVLLYRARQASGGSPGASWCSVVDAYPCATEDPALLLMRFVARCGTLAPCARSVVPVACVQHRASCAMPGVDGCGEGRPASFGAICGDP